jgi:glutaredoxin 2
MALKKSDLEGIREIVEISKLIGEVQKTITIKVNPSYDVEKVLDLITGLFKGLLKPEFITALAEEKKEEALAAATEAKEGSKLW